MTEVRIFNIQRFSINDGPGIRTTVFLKGCPMHCPWCANPESQSNGVVLLHDEDKCAHCGRCAAACPEGIINVTKETYSIRRESCTLCRKCGKACLSNAITFSGKTVNIREVTDIVLRDRVYYEESGGGVTFSGGEPLLQAKAVREMAEEMRKEGIRTAMETAAMVDTQTFRLGTGEIDLLIMDFKSADREKLLRVTGARLEQIDANARTAAEEGKKILARIPVIPGFNDSEQDMNELFSHIRSFGIREADLLPYHLLGAKKYRSMGRVYPYSAYPTALKKTDLIPLGRIGEKYGIRMTISGKRP